MMSRQDINAGDNSTNVQGKEVTINHYNGLTYSDAREIAMNVYKSNFLQLADEASQTAKARAEELIDKFLKDLEQKNPNGLIQMNDPDIQFGIFNAQKAYARSGNKDLADILVDILVERSKIKEESLVQIVLNESLEVAPKLTSNQLDILSLVFLLRYSKRLSLRNIQDFAIYLITDAFPLIDKIITDKNSEFQHLEYTGCGSITVVENKIENLFLANYPGLFSKGFEKEAFETIVNSTNIKLSKSVLIPCLNNATLYQFNALNNETLQEISLNAGADISLAEKFNEFQKSTLFSPEEVIEFLNKQYPSLEQLTKIWNNSTLKKMTLTSVGISISIANLKRKTPNQYDLSIWI